MYIKVTHKHNYRDYWIIDTKNIKNNPYIATALNISDINDIVFKAYNIGKSLLKKYNDPLFDNEKLSIRYNFGDNTYDDYLYIRYRNYNNYNEDYNIDVIDVLNKIYLTDFEFEKIDDSSPIIEEYNNIVKDNLKYRFYIGETLVDFNNVDPFDEYNMKKYAVIEKELNESYNHFIPKDPRYVTETIYKYVISLEDNIYIIATDEITFYTIIGGDPIHSGYIDKTNSTIVIYSFYNDLLLQDINKKYLMLSYIKGDNFGYVIYNKILHQKDNLKKHYDMKELINEQIPFINNSITEAFNKDKKD